MFHRHVRQNSIDGVVNGRCGVHVFDGEELGELDLISHLTNHQLKGARALGVKVVQVLLEDDGDILTRPVELRQLLLVLRTCASYVATSACVHVSGSD